MTSLPPDLEGDIPRLRILLQRALEVEAVDKPLSIETSQRPAEETSLERRVLAHERILQIVIAHLVQSEPNLLSRLNDVFITPMKMERCEHEYTNTESFAEECVRAIILINDVKIK